MDPLLWHYDNLEQWNEKYYKDVFLLTHLIGDEIAIGKDDEREYFYTAKKDNIMYLIPSEIIESGDMPFIALETLKTAYKGKAFQVIKKIKSVVLREERTITYKEMIDSWMDYDNEEKERYT